MSRHTFLWLLVYLLVPTCWMAFLCSCAQKKHPVGGYAAPPECVQIKCEGTWRVKDAGAYCEGKVVAHVLCYQAPKETTASSR